MHDFRHITAIFSQCFLKISESSQTFMKSSQLHQASILVLAQTLNPHHRKPETEKAMNTKLFNHVIDSDSIIEDVNSDLILRARNVALEFCRQIKRGMTEIDVIRQDQQKKQQQVYRHSIGRMSNHKKLQMGLYRD
jgi:hypothetical protein